MRKIHACLPLLLALTGCTVDPTLGQVLVAAGTAVAGPVGGAIVGAATSGGVGGARPTGSTGAGGPIIAPVARGGAVGTPTGGDPMAQVLDLVNRYRATAGLSAVTYDEATNKACADHANYLVLNHGNPALDGFGAHKEDPGLPGATAGWANLNRGNDVGWEHPVATIDGLMATLYHRTQMIDTNLVKIGFGFAGDPDKGNGADVLAFIDSDAPAGEVAYPANGQTEVPLAFGGEFPNPIPDGAPEAGYPITLQEPSDATMTGFAGSLTDDAGNDVPCYYSDKEHEASTLYDQGNTVCLMAKRALQPGHTYKVHVTGTLDGAARTWDWSFSTLPVPKAFDALDDAAMAASFGKLAAIEGKVYNAGTLDDGTVFMNFDQDMNPSAFFGADVWRQIAFGDPKDLVGKRVHFMCMPRKTTDSVELDVKDPTWFKVL